MLTCVASTLHATFITLQFDVGATGFYLAYTGFDNKEHMQTLYKVDKCMQIGRLSAAQVMVKADPALKFVAPHLAAFKPNTPLATGAVPLTSTGKIKVGIVSRHLRHHSIGEGIRTSNTH